MNDGGGCGERKESVRLAQQQVVSGCNSCPVTALQYRYSVLLVYFQLGNCRLHRLLKGCNGMGIQLCNLLSGYVRSIPGKCSREGYSQIFPDCYHLLCGRYGGYRILYLLRWSAQGQCTGLDWYLHLLWFYYGYRSWYRLSFPC